MKQPKSLDNRPDAQFLQRELKKLCEGHFFLSKLAFDERAIIRKHTDRLRLVEEDLTRTRRCIQNDMDDLGIKGVLPDDFALRQITTAASTTTNQFGISEEHRKEIGRAWETISRLYGIPKT